MRNSVVQLLFVWIRLRIRFANALGDHFRIALLVAGIFAVFALHPGGVFEEFSTQSTSHNVVELL